ncbi:p-loop containing nucleoside triphosphate hydrolase [Fusarium sporotrichioides]|uniref:p-loop containing nucleoside triphosphate hydrolase n=1 Tax=Fusarium sporotrichioides TaxID=5514 RepID=A0A395SBR1_FUSSP|nr:p-loop containing nucleoside triphosphate hydrolase [Fusarium sporotrichioides]
MASQQLTRTSVQAAADDEPVKESKASTTWTFQVPASFNFEYRSQNSLPPAPRMDALNSLVGVHPHLRLLEDNLPKTGLSESVPVFTAEVFDALPDTERPRQYGLLASDIAVGPPQSLNPNEEKLKSRIFYNVADPTSTFICGSQGSGKSHTLSTILENCLLPCDANRLPHPLCGLIFHYDTFISDTGGMPCEAAYLSSHKGVKVRVLCAPSNYYNIKRIYRSLPNVTVEMLQINQADLNTQRMLDLMAISSIKGGGLPLYLHIVSRILRDMRIKQQRTGATFDYAAFKAQVEQQDLSEAQTSGVKSPLTVGQQGINWELKAGQLTIVDLSCPCVTAEAACSLFNICLSLFLEQDATVGRVVALDEAHKYMNDSGDSVTLTESLLSVIRLQRHLGTRVILSTQEPTISPKLLDLCSTVIVHRFTSPAWFMVLKKHLAGVPIETLKKRRVIGSDENPDLDTDEISLSSNLDDLMTNIVELRTGEAILFCPSALIGTSKASNLSPTIFRRLGNGRMKIRVRLRLTEDGGRSIMAN